MFCEKCKRATYCSVKCKNKHWQQHHHLVCAKMAAATQALIEKQKQMMANGGGRGRGQINPKMLEAMKTKNDVRGATHLLRSCEFENH